MLRVFVHSRGYESKQEHVVRGLHVGTGREGEVDEERLVQEGNTGERIDDSDLSNCSAVLSLLSYTSIPCRTDLHSHIYIFYSDPINIYSF